MLKLSPPNQNKDKSRKERQHKQKNRPSAKTVQKKEEIHESDDELQNFPVFPHPEVSTVELPSQTESNFQVTLY